MEEEKAKMLEVVVVEEKKINEEKVVKKEGERKKKVMGKVGEGKRNSEVGGKRNSVQPASGGIGLKSQLQQHPATKSQFSSSTNSYKKHTMLT